MVGCPCSYRLEDGSKPMCLRAALNGLTELSKKQTKEDKQLGGGPSGEGI